MHYRIVVAIKDNAVLGTADIKRTFGLGIKRSDTSTIFSQQIIDGKLLLVLI